MVESLNDYLADCVMESDVKGATNALKKGADVNYIKYQREMLLLAECYSNLSMVKLLFEYGADIESTDEFGFTPFMDSLSHGKIDITKYLIIQSCNINVISNGRYCFNYITHIWYSYEIQKLIFDKNPKYIDFFKQHKIQIHKWIEDELIISNELGFFEGWNPFKKKTQEELNRQLINACKYDVDYYHIQKLIEEGADVNCRSIKDDNMTPLMILCCDPIT